MKKWIVALLCIILACSMFTGCTPADQTDGGGNNNGDNTQQGGDNTDDDNTDDDNTDDDNTDDDNTDENGLPKKHLITDEDGNYGGTLNEQLYGTGAPLNGEYDAPDSGYWMINDFYNMTSTDERTLIPNFSPYQQTMADTSGLACALMIMNYDGLDVQNTYNELALTQKYEEVNNTTVKGNGTTSDGLKALFTEYGYVARNTAYVEEGSGQAENIAAFNTWVKGHLDNGFYVLVRYEDGVDNGWRIIIGIDTMGSDWSRSSVLIMANPNDCSDHYQDGYSIQASGRFYRWWFDAHNDGTRTENFDYLLVAPRETLIRYDRVEEERVAVQEMPENHLIRNADGSYGGTMDEAKYGAGTPLNGAVDEPTSQYHAFVDYYNMENNDTRLILTNYRGFQQTMASSCGICSTFTVLAYYGKNIDLWDEVYLVETYQALTGKIIYNVGVGGSGLRTLVTKGLGFPQFDYTSNSSASYVDDKTSVRFYTYDMFTEWVVGNLSKGTPMPISWRPHGGHWEVIIGYDDMGTDFPYDDVLVLADSGDSWDHYQDGYNTLVASQFYHQWFNGSFTYNQQLAVFDNDPTVDAKA